MAISAVTPPSGFVLDKSVGQSKITPPSGFILDAPKKEEPGFLDKDIPLDSYGNATLSGVQSLGRGLRSAGQFVGKAVTHPIDTAGDVFRSAVNLPYEASEVPAAIHDINQSPDPISHFGKAAQDTAGDAFGQDVLALGTEGALRAAPPILRGAATAAKPVLKAVGKGARAVSESVDPDLVGLGSPRAAHGLRYLGKVGRVLDPEAPAATRVAPPPVKFSTQVARPEPIPEAAPPPVKFSTRIAKPEAVSGATPPPVRFSTRVAKPEPIPQAGIEETPVQNAPTSTPIAKPAASGDSFLDRLRARADEIKQAGHGAESAEPEETLPSGKPLKINGKPVSPNTDLTAAGKASLRKVRAAKRIASPN